MFYDIVVEMPGGSKGFMGYADFHKARDHYKRINGNYLRKKLVTESGEVISSYENPLHYVKDLRTARRGVAGWVHRTFLTPRLLRAFIRVRRIALSLGGRHVAA